MSRGPVMHASSSGGYRGGCTWRTSRRPPSGPGAGRECLTWHVIAFVQCGNLTRAQEILSQMTAIIVRNKQIHEVYGTNGEPLASIWYKPEAPLTWSAGMFIYACRVFEEASATASKHIQF